MAARFSYPSLNRPGLAGDDREGVQVSEDTMTKKHPLIEDSKVLISAGVWDVMSAKLAERAGFHTVVLSGYAVSASHLGEPDFGLLTQTEILDVARRVCRTVSIRVIVDGDTGFGGPLNVIHMVEALIRLMASADDFTGPVNFGNPNELTVLELAEQVIELTASQSEIVFESLPQDDPTQRRPDITLAGTELGWEPQVTLTDGLKRTIEYFEAALSGPILSS